MGLSGFIASIIAGIILVFMSAFITPEPSIDSYLNDNNIQYEEENNAEEDEASDLLKNLQEENEVKEKTPNKLWYNNILNFTRDGASLSIKETEEGQKVVDSDNVANSYGSHSTEIESGEISFEICDKDGHSNFCHSSAEVDEHLKNEFYIKEFTLTGGKLKSYCFTSTNAAVTINNATKEIVENVLNEYKQAKEPTVHFKTTNDLVMYSKDELNDIVVEEGNYTICINYTSADDIFDIEINQN